MSATDCAREACRRVGRYRVPAGAPHAIRWFVRALWAPRSRRERWLGRLAERLPAPAALVLLARGPATREETAGETGRRLLAGAGADAESLRALSWHGYPGSGRAVDFVFAAGEEAPRWVLKSGPRTAAGRLRGERERLARARARVSPGLAATLPEPLAFAVEQEREWLLLSALPGRTVDAELARWPADEERHRRRLTAAAIWLARFQRETRAPGAAAPAGAPPTAPAGELAPLERALAAGELPRAASHGDFWPRNVLVAEGRDQVVGVVDWEAAREDEPPHRDLFDFVLCHAAGRAPGEGAERAVAAFRAAFLDAGDGHPTRSCLEAWATAAAVARTWLEPLFRLWLAELAAGARELRLVPAPRRQEVARAWLGLYATASRSVFSG